MTFQVLSIVLVCLCLEFLSIGKVSQLLRRVEKKLKFCIINLANFHNIVSFSLRFKQGNERFQLLIP
jgi:hypothetical protein